MWLTSHREAISAAAPHVDLGSVDASYDTVLSSTARHAAKKRYLDLLRDVKYGLVVARSAALAPSGAVKDSTDDAVPDFLPLAGNPQILGILRRRWTECIKCVGADAHLAA